MCKEKGACPCGQEGCPCGELTAAQKALQAHQATQFTTPPVTDMSMTGVSNLDAPLPMRAQHGGYH